MAKMIAKRALTYGTRRLKAGDGFTAPRRDARVLDAIGRAAYDTRDMAAAPMERKKPHALDHDGDGRKGGSKAGAGDDMQALRAEYQKVVGKRAFPGWDAAELKRRMAEAVAS
jgi:hypothetical protein